MRGHRLVAGFAAVLLVASLAPAAAWAQDSIISINGGSYQGLAPVRVIDGSDTNIERELAVFRSAHGIAIINAAQQRVRERTRWISSSAREVIGAFFGEAMTGIERLDSGRDTVDGVDYRHFTFNAQLEGERLNCVSFTGGRSAYGLTGVICEAPGTFDSSADAIGAIRWIEVEGFF